MAGTGGSPRPHHGGVLVGVALGGGGVTVGVLHAVVVLGGRGARHPPSSGRRGALQLRVCLVALGDRVEELVTAHVHLGAWGRGGQNWGASRRRR